MMSTRLHEWAGSVILCSLHAFPSVAHFESTHTCMHSTWQTCCMHLTSQKPIKLHNVTFLQHTVCLSKYAYMYNHSTHIVVQSQYGLLPIHKTVGNSLENLPILLQIRIWNISFLSPTIFSKATKVFPTS